MEVEAQPEGGVAGRFTVRQAHEGPPGHAHGGIVGAALDEAMALLLQSEGLDARTAHMEVDCLLYTSPSPRDVEESRMPSSA